MRKYKFTPPIIASIAIMTVLFILPFLPWLTTDNANISAIMLTANNQKVNFSLWLCTAIYLLIWVSQGLSIPSLILYFIRKQYAPRMLPMFSSILMVVSSTILIITAFIQGTRLTFVPFIAVILAVINMVLVLLIKKSK